MNLRLMGQLLLTIILYQWVHRKGRNMKILETLFLLLCLGTVAFAFTTTTGQGYYSYNGQVVSYYQFVPGNYSDSDVIAVDTNGTNPSINQTASCEYYQMHNPTINMNC